MAENDPVVEDMSIYLLSGRKRSADIPSVVEEAEDAERLGFSRAWVSERYDNKEAGLILGIAGAHTSTIGLGTAPIPIGSRPMLLTAALGATVQSAFGPRFSLGIGRSLSGWIAGHGFNETTFEALVDYATVVKRLLRGEHVTYDGPAGSIDLKIDDLPEGPPPEIIFWNMGGPKAARYGAHPAFDGVGYNECLTAEAVGQAARWSKEECERIGRDPDSLRIIAGVTTAPDCAEQEMLKHIGSRLLLFLQGPWMGEYFCRRNGWDESILTKIRSHPIFRDIPPGGWSDHVYQRDEVTDVAKELIPEEYMRTAGAIGTAEECVQSLENFRRAGADEIAIYAGPPSENAGLIKAWRSRAQAGA